MKPGALALVNMEAIEPVTVTSAGQVYPEDACLKNCFAQVTPNVTYLDGPQIADSLGNPKVANVILLGALSTLMEKRGLVGLEVSIELWLDCLSERVPQKHVELNKRAFLTGRGAV